MMKQNHVGLGRDLAVYENNVESVIDKVADRDAEY